MTKTTTFAAKPLQSAEAWHAGQYAYLIGEKIVHVPARLLTSNEIDAHARAISPDTRHNDTVPIALPDDFAKANRVPKPKVAVKKAPKKKKSSR